MLDLNDLRRAFAAHLSSDPLRFSMDKALAHVCQLAYQRGMEDGAKADRCRHCGGVLKPSSSLQMTATPGMPRFQGGESFTILPAGQCRLIDCLKCEVCGWSITAP